MSIDVNETRDDSFLRYDYRLGFVVRYFLQDEPACDDSWILFPAEVLWNRWLRGTLYVLGLGFLFVGISIVSDIFMQSIEMITSKKRVVKYYDAEAQVMAQKEVLIWNETVANLTLMALGSSAPEIMLSTVETCLNLGNEKKKDGLGVFTIIGSAAFNLLIIISVCISAVGPAPKRIRQFGVFLLTSFWSMFAYVWLLIVLDYVTPGEVDWWEALITLLFFPLLVLSAYYTDLITAKKRKRKKAAFVERRRSSMGAVSGIRVGSITHRQKKGSVGQVLKELANSTGSQASYSNGYGHATTSFSPKRKKHAEEESNGIVSGAAGVTSSGGVSIEEQLKDQNILKWQEIKVFSDRMNKQVSSGSEDRISRLVQLLTLTQDKDDLRRMGSKLGANGEMTKPRVMFLSPQIVTEPGDTVARVEVIITYVPPNQSNEETKNQTKDDMFLERQANDALVHSMTNGASSPTTSSVFSTPSLHRIKKSPRLSVTAIDSAYGSTSSMTKREPRPRLPADSRRGGDEDNANDIDLSELSVKFETRDATAKSGVHYKTTQGQLVFSNEKRVCVIEIPLMDNYLSSAVEREVFVILHSPSKAVQLGKTSITRVNIIPNVGAEVGFESDFYYLNCKKDKEVILNVQRYDALNTRVSVEYSTELDSAHGGVSLESGLVDYVTSSGLVVFEQQETNKQITIKCHAVPKKAFYVLLKNPVKCKVSPEFGMTHVRLCVEEEDHKNYSGEGLGDVMGGSDANSRVLRVVGSRGGDEMDGRCNAWIRQIKESFEFGEGAFSDEEDEPLTIVDYIGHFLSFLWKVIFAVIIPPASYMGGTLTFWLALANIGALVFLVEELGNLLGCVVGLENAITGITIIALGTSLPDTLASRTAALHEQYADASIGNVTGSNSVNVFLGLGVPWVISTVYNLYLGRGAFTVQTSNLSFSVTAFLAVGVLCLVIIIARRFILGGELGGSKPMRWGSSGFLLLLWIGYTTVCSSKALGYF
ncbi:sodium/calcium exchanger 1-like isoform X2 [Symsagittifera roscoffensis]|uniref:sodium/calcium exchanger 1-like isoform X2 n=1 Tax=Symsagittifera roscoffensis TaxID=84072 RepID=UPI00307B782B